MNKKAWDLSSIRMNCNKTHAYYCVPNKGLTSLIEFCYPRGDKILFQEGNVNVCMQYSVYFNAYTWNPSTKLV